MATESFTADERAPPVRRSGSTGRARRSTSTSSAGAWTSSSSTGLHDLLTNVTDDDPLVTGKIALAHLNEFPDYYTRLERMEEDAKREHGGA
jgi:hypothetical protein